MNVRGLGNPQHPNADRAGDARRSDRTGSSAAQRRADDALLAGGDRIETSSAAEIERAVAAARARANDRILAAREARERLLGLADDPAAIRRAAEGLLDGERV